MAELNRDALLIYLNDLRVMETIIQHSKLKIRSVRNEMSQIEDNYHRFVKNEPTFVKRNYNEEIGRPAVNTFWIVWSIVAIIFGIILFFGFSSTGLSLTFPIILIAVGSCVIILPIISNRKRKLEIYNLEKEQNVKYEKFKVDLDNHKNNVRKKKDELQITKKKCEEAVYQINCEIERFENLRQKAYSANIIPATFRNIEGVYYLYDYLSTSNQSLSEALMQCNLEAIKQKLDNVIKLQSMQIVQQAQTNAKLDSMARQNQRILDTAEKTLEYAADAAEYSMQTAQYAQISATNSEITRELAEKHLAYQRLEYWMK